MIRIAHLTTLGGAVILTGALVAGPAAAPEPPSGEPQSVGEMTPAFLKQCLDVAEEVDPKLAASLRDMQHSSPGPAFERAVRNARHLTGLVRLKDRDPQLYSVKLRELQVDAQVSSVAERVRQARQTGSGGVDELEDELRKLVREQVVLSIAARGMYLQRLRENMKALQDQLEEDAANFNRAVERRMTELCGE